MSRFTDNDNLDAIDEDRDVIYAYEALPQSEDGPQIANIAVYHRYRTFAIQCLTKIRKEEKYSYSYSNLPPSTQLFGTPFFVSVPSPVTYGELYSHVLQAITRWLKPGAISTSIGEAHQSETAEKDILKKFVIFVRFFECCNIIMEHLKRKTQSKMTHPIKYVKSSMLFSL